MPQGLSIFYRFYFIEICRLKLDYEHPGRITRTIYLEGPSTRDEINSISHIKINIHRSFFSSFWGLYNFDLGFSSLFCVVFFFIYVNQFFEDSHKLVLCAWRDTLSISCVSYENLTRDRKIHLLLFTWRRAVDLLFVVRINNFIRSLN